MKAQEQKVSELTYKFNKRLDVVIEANPNENFVVEDRDKSEEMLKNKLYRLRGSNHPLQNQAIKYLQQDILELRTEERNLEIAQGKHLGTLFVSQTPLDNLLAIFEKLAKRKQELQQEQNEKLKNIAEKSLSDTNYLFLFDEKTREEVQKFVVDTAKTQNQLTPQPLTVEDYLAISDKLAEEMSISTQMTKGMTVTEISEKSTHYYQKYEIQLQKEQEQLKVIDMENNIQQETQKEVNYKELWSNYVFDTTLPLIEKDIYAFLNQGGDPDMISSKMSELLGAEVKVPRYIKSQELWETIVKPFRVLPQEKQTELKNSLIDFLEKKKIEEKDLPILIGDRTLLYQPTEVTFMEANLETALEWHIVTLVIEQLQELIKKSIEAKKNRNPIQLVFDEFQGNQDKHIFTFKFKDLNISRASYPRVRETLLKMKRVIVAFKTKNPITGVNRVAYTGFFDEVYEVKKMDRTFRIRMKEKVMERFIEVTNQYTPYLKEVVLNLKKKHTIRLYLLMTTMAYKKSFSYTEKELRKYLGIKKGQYQKVSDLTKLLNNAQEELKKENGLEFSYEYQPKTDKTQAVFLFKVTKIPKTLTKRQEQQEQQQREIIKNILVTHFEISELEILKIEKKITLENYNALLTKIVELKKYINKNYKNIKSINEFALKSIENFLKEIS